MLLLDEPMAALDAGARIDVRTFLRAHLADFAGPVVLVTHDPLEAMVLADRLLVLEAGRVVQQGTPAEVARRPASAYVARLVGPQPLVRDPRRRRTWSGSMTAATLAVATEAPPGPVLVSLRPSAITVHTEHPEHTSTRNVWPGRVAAMEVLADRVRLQVDGAPVGAGRRHARGGRRARPRGGPRGLALGQGHRGRGVRRPGPRLVDQCHPHGGPVIGQPCDAASRSPCDHSVSVGLKNTGNDLWHDKEELLEMPTPFPSELLTTFRSMAEIVYSGESFDSVYDAVCKTRRRARRRL